MTAAPEIVTKRTKMVPVSQLTVHPDNPRSGDVAKLKELISANGFIGALVVQESTGFILVGNHRYQAAEALGIDKVPVWYVDVDDHKAKQIMLADNRATDFAGYDDAKLAELIQSIAAEEPDELTGTGFTSNDLDRLLRDIQAKAQPKETRGTFGTGKSMDRYSNTDLRQIQLLMTVDEYDVLLDAFEAIMEKHELATNYDVVLFLLDRYQADEA